MKKYSLYFLLLNLVVFISCGKQKTINKESEEIEKSTEQIVPYTGNKKNETPKTTNTANDVLDESVVNDKEINQDVNTKLENTTEEAVEKINKADVKTIKEKAEVIHKKEQEVVEERVEEQVTETALVIKKDAKDLYDKKTNTITEEKEELVGKEKEIEVLDHKLFDAFLHKYVSLTGDVNYKMMKSHQIELESYINLLQNNPLKNNWTRNQKLAYWINTYNAFTLKLILDNYPVSSITDIAGGKPWDKKWIPLGGKVYSLNQIENDIIRPQFKEPRIHFAVNCAAKSCPKLGNFAYTAGNLNAKLTSQTKAFVNSSENEMSSNNIKISKIFEWYKSDFGVLNTFLNKYSTTKINTDATVEYNEYDWSLNGM